MYLYMSLDAYSYTCVCTHMCVVTMSYLPFVDHQSIPELRKKLYMPVVDRKYMYQTKCLAHVKPSSLLLSRTPDPMSLRCAEICTKVTFSDS